MIKEYTHIKVIAHFPDMIVEVGQEIECPKGMRFYATQENKVDPLDYPHLFEIVEV